MCMICDDSDDNDLSNISELKIMYCNTIKYMPEIKNLKKLIIYVCPNLEYIESFDKLEHLEIYYCGNLININKMPLLKYIKIYLCEYLYTLDNISSKLENISIDGNYYIKHIPFFKTLKEIDIKHCYITSIIIPKNIKININQDKLEIVNLENIIISKNIYNALHLILNQYKIYKLKQKINKYASFLQKNIYSNPKYPYIHYVINAKNFESKNKVGYITNNNKLKFLTTK